MADAVITSGTVGSGKTTVAEALGALQRQQGTPHAVVDLDALGQCWPSPPDDRFNSRLTRQNLAGLVRNFRAAGAVRLILAGVVESPSEAAGV